jgi:hypothetical protein
MVGRLAADFLTYDTKDAVLLDTIPNAAHDEFLVFRRKAGRVHHIELQGYLELILLTSWPPGPLL